MPLPGLLPVGKSRQEATIRSYLYGSQCKNNRFLKIFLINVSTQEVLMSSKLQKRRRGSVMGGISGGLETMGLKMKGLGMKGLGMKGLGMKGLEMKGLKMKGLEMKGLGMKGLGMKGLGMKGLEMKGLEMKGLKMTGLKMTARVISTLCLRRRPKNVEATLAVIWLLCVIILAACSGNGGGGAVNVAPAKPPASGTVRSGGGGPDAVVDASTPAPGAKLGPQPCPATVSSPSYWEPIVGTQPGVNKVESVTCGNLTGSATLQALVTVRTNDAANTLDLYVYDMITNPQPTQLFSLSGLYNGDARISPYNTVITAEVDVNSSVNKGQPPSAYQRDLCREFKWSPGAGTLVRVAFPGIFPDLTRYQAEADQQRVNGGRDPWKLSAVQTAQAFAANFLKWPASSPATITSGGGAHDANAIVTVRGPAPGGNSSIAVEMSRLEGNTSNGIWIVTHVTSPNLTISAPAYPGPGEPFPMVVSPVAVSGTGNAFEGVVGQVKILDHTYTSIGQAQARATGTNGMGNVPYAANVGYTSTFKIGVQEGVIMLYAISNADGSISGAVIFKLLLG